MSALGEAATALSFKAVQTAGPGEVQSLVRETTQERKMPNLALATTKTAWEYPLTHLLISREKSHPYSRLTHTRLSKGSCHGGLRPHPDLARWQRAEALPSLLLSGPNEGNSHAPLRQVRAPLLALWALHKLGLPVLTATPVITATIHRRLTV